MIIRKMQPTDLDQVMTIWLDGNCSAHPFIDRRYWIDHSSMVREALLHAEVFVAVDHSTILGFVGLQENYLAGIFVKNTYRHQGIGTQLLQLVKKNYSSFTLEVYVQNVNAVNFYQQAGLQIIRRQVDETGHDEYVMQWKE